MSAGYQAVQSSHALLMFAREYNDIYCKWYDESNYLVQVSTDTEKSLEQYIEKAAKNDIKCVIFREPDLNNEITAIALEPGNASKRLISSLPKMLKEYKNEI